MCINSVMYTQTISLRIQLFGLSVLGRLFQPWQIFTNTHVWCDCAGKNVWLVMKAAGKKGFNASCTSLAVSLIKALLGFH